MHCPDYVLITNLHHLRWPTDRLLPCLTTAITTASTIIFTATDHTSTTHCKKHNKSLSLFVLLQVCDITAHTVLLYVLFCLIYMYCTLYVLYILHTVHKVHVLCFPVSDVEILSSTSVHHTSSHFIKYSHTSVHLVSSTTVN